jgi:SAM-dependent methyltransferase
MISTLFEEMSRLERVHWWFVGRRVLLTSLTENSSHRKIPLRICELGCGSAENIAALSNRHDVIGVECSPVAREFAQKKLGNRIVSGSLPNDVPLESGSFDAILLPDVLEHIEEDGASFRKALDLLKPGGVAVVTVPAYAWMYCQRDRWHHHYRRYSKRAFEQVLNAEGATIEVLSYFNSTLFPIALAARLWLKYVVGERAQVEDMRVPSRPLNFLFRRILEWESSLLRFVRLPFGLSLVAVVRKNTAKEATSNIAA